MNFLVRIARTSGERKYDCRSGYVELESKAEDVVPLFWRAETYVEGNPVDPLGSDGVRHWVLHLVPKLHINFR